MNSVQELYSHYLAADLKRRAVAEKICDKERSIERLQRQIEKLEKSQYEDNWMTTLLHPLAAALTPLLECERYKIYGPFGLRASTSICFMKQGSDETGYILSLTMRTDYNEDALYKDRYCPATTKSVQLFYDTFKRTKQYPEGSIGELNGFNNIEAPLPDDLQDIVKILKQQEK